MPRPRRTRSRVPDRSARRTTPARWRQGWLAPVDYSARTRYRPPPPLYQRVQQRLAPWLIGLGLGPKDVVVLEVAGRRSARLRRTVLVQARIDRASYLVALAGESEWVRNVRAAGGRARVGRRTLRDVRLEQVDPEDRPPVLRAYLLRWGRMPGTPVVEREARMFFGVSGDPSMEELRAIADRYPVFRIVPTDADDPVR